MNQSLIYRAATWIALTCIEWGFVKLLDYGLKALKKYRRRESWNPFVPPQTALALSAVQFGSQATTESVMSEEQKRFLSLAGRLPARLDAEQVAWLVNCHAHDVPVLVRARLLRPLGNSSANARKLFSADEVLELCHDKAWLTRVSNAIHEGWRRKNASRRMQPDARELAAMAA